VKRNAPIGPRPAHRVFTDSPAFRAWFSGSVLVREDGDPLVLFHGTDKDFSVFEKTGTSSLRPLGFWFADDPDAAEPYGDRLMPVYLRVERPYYAELAPLQEKSYADKTWARRFRDELIAQGYDGIIILPRMEEVGRFRLRDSLLAVVFDPRQVKSAVGNRGTFDKSSPDITLNPSGRGGTGRRARLKIEFPYRSASSSLAAPTTRKQKANPTIDLREYASPLEEDGFWSYWRALKALSPARGERGPRNEAAHAAMSRRGYTLGRTLGSGLHATTYTIVGHPDKVAKVTNDPMDAAVMAEVMNRKLYATNKGFPIVYGVFQLPEKFGGKAAYVIIVERLRPLSPDETMEMVSISREYDKGWRAAIGDLASVRMSSSPMEAAMVEAIMLLRAYGFLIGDVHPKNLMRRKDGAYVISDFGMSGVEEGARTQSDDVPIANPRDLKGRSIPERYLAGLPAPVRRERVRELTESRDAYRRGDYSELPSDRIARKMGLVKKSVYSKVAEARGIEWRGDAEDMARRVCAYYRVARTPAVARGITASFRKGLAAWKSGGHRPGATAQNWAVARVASLVVGGKTSVTADRNEFAAFPAPLRKAIEAARPAENRALLPS